MGIALLEDCNLEKDDVKVDSLKSPEPLSHERNESLDSRTAQIKKREEDKSEGMNSSRLSLRH